MGKLKIASVTIILLKSIKAIKNIAEKSDHGQKSQKCTK